MVLLYRVTLVHFALRYTSNYKVSKRENRRFLLSLKGGGAHASTFDGVVRWTIREEELDVGTVDSLGADDVDSLRVTGLSLIHI